LFAIAKHSTDISKNQEPRKLIELKVAVEYLLSAVCNA
jgi:hypothetical protein